MVTFTEEILNGKFNILCNNFHEMGYAGCVVKETQPKLNVHEAFGRHMNVLCSFNLGRVFTYGVQMI